MGSLSLFMSSWGNLIITLVITSLFHCLLPPISELRRAEVTVHWPPLIPSCLLFRGTQQSLLTEYSAFFSDEICSFWLDVMAPTVTQGGGRPNQEHPWVWGQPGLHTKTSSQKANEKDLGDGSVGKASALQTERHELRFPGPHNC